MEKCESSADRAAGECRERAAALPGDVVRALAWLRAHPAEPFALEQLAAFAGVRARTLEAHFRQFVGESPRVIARRIRLDNVRRQLLVADPCANVTSIAGAAGFSQPGRFAAEYRRSYGELPSQTLRRARHATQGIDADIDDEAVRLVFRALTAAFAVAPAQCSRALEDATAAQALAPNYALPKSLIAWCQRVQAAQRFRTAALQDADDSCRLAEEARRLAPDDALVLSLAAGTLTLSGGLDEADVLLGRARVLDPWSAWVWMRTGWSSAYHGDASAALRELKFALQLMPFEPIRHVIVIGIGSAHFEAGRYDRAAAWVRDGVAACPESFWASRITAAAAAHAGARDEARRIVRTIRRRDPDLTVAEARAAWPFRPSFMDRLGDGLRRAGLP